MALRELVLLLGVEIDKDELKDAEEGLNDFLDSAHKYAAAAAVALAGIGIAVVEMGRDMAVGIEAGSHQLGISRQEFQQWEAVARAAGAEGEKIIDVMANLQEKARDAALDPRGQMAKTFRDLGISARDANGHIKAGPQLMREAANALARMGPGTEQTATAMQLFGDAGRELLPVLGQGSAAIDQIISDFDEMGGGLDDEAIESSLEFNRALLALKATLAGALSPVLRALNPIVTAMAEWFTMAATKARAFAENSTALRAGLIGLTLGVSYLTGALIAHNIAGMIANLVVWAPFIATMLIAAGTIAAVTLAVDDLMTYLEGGDSVIGLWMDALGGDGTAERNLEKIREKIFEVKAGIEFARNAVENWESVFDQARVAGELFTETMKLKLIPLEVMILRIKMSIEQLIGPLRTAVNLLGGLQQGAFNEAAGAVTGNPAAAPPAISGAGFGDGVIAQAGGQRISAPSANQGGRASSVTSQAALTIAVNGVVDQRIIAPLIEQGVRAALDAQSADIADAVQGS